MGKQESVETIELVARSCGGDEHAQGRLLERVDSQIRNLARSMDVPRHDLSDVAQEAKLKVFQKLPHLREWPSFRGWLARIVTNCIHLVRRRRRRQSIPCSGELGEVIDSGTEPAQHLLRRQLRERVESFPEPRRTIFRLHFQEQRTHREIANLLGLTHGVVAHQIAKGVAELSMCFRDPMSVSGDDR